eukprot:GCRY01005133.1.p1 GENE.GCRY01005133.1~~GCRY01005133.1.p1  ORF type:complete len:677 (+),score=131.20 GCRY01005133.1:102-2033(+)
MMGNSSENYSSEAFQKQLTNNVLFIVAGNATFFCLVSIFYLNYQLVSDYFTSLILACLVAVYLRDLKSIIVDYFERESGIVYVEDSPMLVESYETQGIENNIFLSLSYKIILLLIAPLVSITLQFFFFFSSSLANSSLELWKKFLERHGVCDLSQDLFGNRGFSSFHWKQLFNFYCIFFVYHHPYLALIILLTIGLFLTLIDLLMFHFPEIFPFMFSMLPFFEHVRRCFRFFGHYFKVIRHRFRSFTLKHIHEFVSLWLLATAFLIMSVVTGWLLFHCVQEGVQFGTQQVNNLDAFVSGSSETIRNLTEQGVEWLQANHPQQATRLKELWDTVKTLQLENSFQNQTSSLLANDTVVFSDMFRNIANEPTNLLKWKDILVAVQQPGALYRLLNTSSLFVFTQPQRLWELLKWGFSSAFDIFSIPFQNVLPVVFSLLTHLLSSSFTLADTLFSVLLFLSTIYYLLAARIDFLSSLLGYLPVSPSYKSKLEEGVQTSVTRVLGCLLRVSLYNALATFISLQALSAPFVFIPTVAVALVSFIPFISPSLLVVIPYLPYYYYNEAYFSAMILLLLHCVYLPFWVVPAIYEDIPHSHPYYTGISIALGLARFGIQGAILAPCLICLPVVAIFIPLSAHTSALSTPTKAE